MNKKKLLISLSIVAVAAVIAIGGSVAYFSDTETSAGNTFKAGKLNLKVDSTCHYNGKECVYNENLQKYYWDDTEEECFCSWAEKDLDGELFFNLDDVKPGDSGEDTISLHVINNDAWMCAQIANLKNYDNGCDQPEIQGDTTCGIPGEGEGELQDYLKLTLWKDNGADDLSCNNILDAGEEIFVNNQPISSTLWPLADVTTGKGPFIGDETYCIGAAWNVPITTGNIIQTDSVTVDVRFVAVQARHMENFKCLDLFTEVCDGIDNDYNGTIDDSWPTLGQTCSVGAGACAAEGVYICDSGNPSGEAVCSAIAGTGTTEVCDDGIDNDCDGVIDNGCYGLTVSKTGNGSGTVTGTGVDCGTDCGENYLEGTTVTLTASPDVSSNFTGWSGVCSGTSPTCSFTVGSSPITVTANFSLKTLTLNVYKSGTGSGVVMAYGINCGTDCTETYNYNTSVSLRAEPGTSYIFGGWDGGCDSTSEFSGYYYCDFNIKANKNITAKFWSLHGSLQTVTMPAVLDTYVDDKTPSTAYGSLPYFYVKAITGTNGNFRNGLVKFNMPSIPGGNTIAQADLKLYAYGLPSLGNTFTTAKVITSDWSEATNWSNQPSTTYDFSSTISVSGPGLHIWNVKNAVNKFRSGALTNYGWMIDAGPGTDINYRSREYGTAAERPQLVITYGNYY